MTTKEARARLQVAGAVLEDSLFGPIRREPVRHLALALLSGYMVGKSSRLIKVILSAANMMLRG